MPRRVLWKPEAEQDAIDIAAFIGDDRQTAAIRFFQAVDGTLEGLLAMPRTGRLRDSEQPMLAGVRSRPVKGFGNYLIFYRVVDAGIEVVRVLHGARDLPTIFDPPV